MPSAYIKVKRLLHSRVRILYQNTGEKVVIALLLLLIMVRVLSLVQGTNTRRHDVTLNQLNSTSPPRTMPSSTKAPRRTKTRQSVTRQRLRGTVELSTAVTAVQLPLERGTSGLKSCNVSVPRPLTPSAEPQRWQQVAGRNVSVFSAYVDRRVDAGGPLIRIIASSLLKAYTSGVGELYCQMWFADTAASVITGPATFELISSTQKNPTTWTAHFVLCPFNGSAEEAPQLVSVVDQPSCMAANVLLVLDSHHFSRTTSRSDFRKRRNVSFALCLPPLYGRLSLYVTERPFSFVLSNIQHDMLGAQQFCHFVRDLYGLLFGEMRDQ